MTLIRELIKLSNIHTYIHTYAHPFNRPKSGTTWVSRYQKEKTNLDLLEQNQTQYTMKNINGC